MKLIGNKEIVGFEIGPYCAGSKQLQEINTWVKGKHIHVHDNIVYLPAFYTHLEREILALEKNDYSQSGLMNRSDDELYAHLMENWEQLILRYDIGVNPAWCVFVESPPSDFILFSLQDLQSEIGNLFKVEISKQQLLKTLRELLANLSNA